MEMDSLPQNVDIALSRHMPEDIVDEACRISLKPVIVVQKLLALVKSLPEVANGLGDRLQGKATFVIVVGPGPPWPLTVGMLDDRLELL